MATRVSWGNAGWTYYAVVEGQIVALLYFEEEGPGEKGGPGGEPVITEPAWFLVHVDEPDDHIALGTAPLTREMSDHEIAQLTDTAIAEATELIEQAFDDEEDD